MLRKTAFLIFVLKGIVCENRGEAGGEWYQSIPIDPVFKLSGGILTFAIKFKNRKTKQL